MHRITPFDCREYYFAYKNKKAQLKPVELSVRAKGLEPPRLSALDPKSSAATNYATPALRLGLQR